MSRINPEWNNTSTASLHFRNSIHNAVVSLITNTISLSLIEITMTASANAALIHLNSIKPNDGWAVKRENNGLLRLYRRNIPLTDNSFMDIHYCAQNQVVVGVLTEAATTCQVIVNKSGQPLIGRTFVSCKDTYDPNKVNYPATRSNPRSTNPSQTSSNPATPVLSPEDNKMILQYGLIVVAASIFLKLLSSSLAGLIYLVGLPLLYLYALSTCPPANSFDAKKELKRVLRGHHLPENHPEKPKGFLEEMATRVAASITTELATLPGYEVSMLPIAAGAVILADVIIPTANTQHYWLGAFGKWHYVYSRERSSRMD